MVAGYNQDQVGAAVKKDRSLISRWENGWIEFDDDVAKSIARLYKVPLADLQHTPSGNTKPQIDLPLAGVSP